MTMGAVETTAKAKATFAKGTIPWGTMTARVALATALAFGAGAPAFAAGTAAGATGSGAAAQQAQAGIDFDIPAQDLNAALLSFADATGIQVFFDAATVDGLRSTALSGHYSVEGGLNTLLQGTGVVPTFTGPTTVSLEKPAADAVTLSPISIEGASPTLPGGYANTYVATSNSAGMKTDTPIIETPQSVSVVTREQMEAAAPDSLAQALSYTPGVNAQAPVFSATVDDFQLRGFNVANGSSGMLRDGLKLQSNVYDGGQEPYGLERVEVLRGPASILYGQLSPGGVVNAVTKKPTGATFGELGFEYGSFDHKQFEADLGAPISDALSFRLTGMVRDADTSVDDVYNNRRYIAPSLAWTPSNDTSLVVQASYQQTRTRFAAPMPFADLDAGIVSQHRFIGEPDFDLYNTDSFTIGYAFDTKATDWLTLRSSMRFYRAEVQWDYLTYGQRVGDTLYRTVSNRDETSTGFTADNAAELSFATGPAKHTFLAGIDVYKSSYNRHRHSGNITTISLSDPQYGAQITPAGSDFGDNTESNQAGLYFQDQIKLWDKLVILLGGRQDWSTSSTESYRTGATTDTEASAFTGRAGLVYLFDNGIAPYASFSQSFSPQSGTDRSGGAFDPTKGTQYEVGVRYQPANSGLMLSAAAYHLTQTNVLTPDPVDSTYSVQTGEVVSKGFELEAKYSAGALNLIGAYAYTDARTTESNTPGEIDQRVALVPEHSVSGWVDYGFDDLGIPGLRLGSGVKYISSTNVSGAAEHVPGRVLMDAMARYDLGAIVPEMKGAMLKLNVTNLTGTEYMTCVNASGCRYGEPRTITGGLTYRW